VHRRKNEAFALRKEVFIARGGRERRKHTSLGRKRKRYILCNNLLKKKKKRQTRSGGLQCIEIQCTSSAWGDKEVAEPVSGKKNGRISDLVEEGENSQAISRLHKTF